jgi:cytochrome c
MFIRILLVALLATPAIAQGELRGHGGPVRALSITPDGREAISGSFDSSAIVWALERCTARAVLRAHESAVHAVGVTPHGFVTAGEDGRLAIWARNDLTKPIRIDKIHTAPIAALNISPDGKTIATASWDSSLALTPLDGGTLRRLEGHQGNVNGVGFLPDGETLVSAGYDATLRIWPAKGAARVIKLDAPLNALSIAPDGRMAAGGSDGTLFLLDAQGNNLRKIEAADSPLIAIAFSPDSARLAAASPRGSVTLFDTASGKALFTLNGPGLPVWSLAFSADGKVLFTGGGDRLVRRWSAVNGDHLGPIVIEKPAEMFVSDGSRGADVFKACAVCHTLTPDAENRAGPTLYGVLGRRIGTAPGYVYSAGFAAHDIVWTKETIAKLFELGPSTYTPGTKMPEQRVSSHEDRAALADFIEKATRQR